MEGYTILSLLLCLSVASAFSNGACTMDSECAYGGTCDVSTLMCSCATGYSGANCGTGACTMDSECAYRGTCDVSTLMCSCATGYSGANCGTGLRLAGEGSSLSQGRVEVFANGKWGTVCDDLWGLEDANVVCRQLGFPGASEYTAMAWPFGEGSGEIHLDNVACVGDETSIMDCPQNEIGMHNCGHWNDAGVVCHEVRLAGSGSSANQGRVEVFVNGQWGTVCDDRWGKKDADVVCEQLGFLGSSGFTIEAKTFGEGSGEIFMDNVECKGDEWSIIDCPQNPIGRHNCGHHEDAGVICQVQDNGATPEPADPFHAVVRLGGENKQDSVGHGVVEVYRDGQWGTVCGIGWTQADANVVCKQLGFTGPVFFHYDSVWKFFGSGNGSILLADVVCTGEEASIMDCPASSTEIPPSCTHEKDAEVQCLESDKKRKVEDLEFYEKGDMTEEEKVAAEERSNDKKDSDLKKKAVLEALVDLLVYLDDK